MGSRRPSQMVSPDDSISRRDMFASMLQIGDERDLKLKPKVEHDVSMCTLLQHTHMLPAEIQLHEACRVNNIEQVHHLISKRVNINSRNNLDRTALHCAAANGNLRVMEMLINAGADIEAQDKYGMCPLLWSAWFGHIGGVRILVNSGALPNARNKQGLSLLHCAAHNNHVDVVKFVVDSLEHYVIDDTEKHEKTSLILACEKGHLDTVNLLLENRCDVTKKDKTGQTAVHVSSSHGHPEVLARLLEHGVEVNDRDSEGRTALHLAAEKGHVKVAETLLAASVDCNTETTKEDTPLHLAAMHGHYDVIQSLLSNDCEINAQNQKGNTALHLAALSNHLEVVSLLIDNYASTEVTNHRLQTPLHTAVELGLDQVVESLLIAGSDLEAKERMGKTPLSLASRGSFIGIVDMIIKADRLVFNQLPKLSMASDNGVNSILSTKLKSSSHDCSQVLKEILWKLAYKYLKAQDWRKLAVYWKFTDCHIRAIEHQYTGTNSYKEHGYRLLLIWVHALRKDTNPIKELFEALVAIDRRDLAENIRKKASVQGSNKSPSHRSCIMS